MKLLTINSSKINKSNNSEWITAILYLEPSYDYSKICTGSTPACRKSCLVHSGRMKMERSINARMKRTELYIKNKELFIYLLKNELDELLIKAYKQGKKLAVRLNGTSDLDWSEIYEEYPLIQFYEYTKVYNRRIKFDNLVVIRSASEKIEDLNIMEWLQDGYCVAKVFKELPTKWNNIPVINGDEHDRVWEHKSGSLIGLKLKGTNRIKQLALATKFSEEQTNAKYNSYFEQL